MWRRDMFVACPIDSFQDGGSREGLGLMDVNG